MGRDESMQSWRTGALATAAGITARTLRHYEQVGLLTPSGRTDAEHRVYSAEDVTRLYRIFGLRHLSLSLSLEEIRTALESIARSSGNNGFADVFVRCSQR
ncbi:MAG: MerR family transcriptional regulator [Dehalococcoidia bacterium]|nr:MerR family transcriptional regulator [Dehalococcoidia bacterium]